MNSLRSKAYGIFYIILAAVFWGVFPVFNRLLYANGFTVFEASAYRAFSAALIYLIWGAASGEFKSIKIKSLPFFAFYGLVSVFGTFLFYALAIRELSAAMAAMLLYTAPSFVIIFSRIIYKEKITPVKLVALILTFCGCFLVIRGYDISSLKVNARGIFYGLMSGISYSMLTVVGRYSLAKYSRLQNTFLPTIFASLIFMVICPPHTLSGFSGINIIYILATGIIGTVLPYFFYMKGLSIGVDGGKASILANIEPIVATVCGTVFFQDFLEIPHQIIGIAITLAGAILPIIADKSKE